MKEKLSVLIIVMVIWFGVADVMKNIELLKLETNQIVSKSRLYISHLESGDAPSDSLRTQRFARREALIDEIKNALCRATMTVVPEREGEAIKTANTNRQIISRKNNAQITLNRKKTDEQLILSEIQRASEEMARIADFSVDSFITIEKLKEINKEFYKRSNALDERKAEEKRLKKLIEVLPEILQKIGE